jgi:nucleotide-binding universal stress UspA family protein
MSRIVVGVDPSPPGIAAMEWALREAVTTGVPLQAVRAWMPRNYGMETYAYALPDDALGEAAEAQLEADQELKLATERVPGAETVVCTAVAVLGSTAQVLVEQGKGSAVLVVGSRGHGALSRAVLGSVSSSVLHHATGPVVIVPEPDEHGGQAPRVVVGVDHSAASLTALSAAAEQARRRGATLVPVYVHQPIELPRGGTHPPDLALLEGNERTMLEAAAKAAGAGEVQAEVLVGNPVVELLAAVRPQDLLVVGSRGRGGFTGLLLGSTSTQVSQHAPCPVLVLRA